MNKLKFVESLLSTLTKEIARLRKRRQTLDTMLKSWILTIRERRYYQNEKILITGKINALEYCCKQLKENT